MTATLSKPIISLVWSHRRPATTCEWFLARKVREEAKGEDEDEDEDHSMLSPCHWLYKTF